MVAVWNPVLLAQYCAKLSFSTLRFSASANVNVRLFTPARFCWWTCMHRWHSSICQPNPLFSSKSHAKFHKISLVVAVRCEVFFTYHRVSCQRGGSEIASLCLDETYPSTEIFVFLVWKSVDPMARQVGVVASKTNTRIHHCDNSNLL